MLISLISAKPEEKRPLTGLGVDNIKVDLKKEYKDVN
jgi:hypothetical protein